MGKGQGASEKGGRLVARNQPRASSRHCDLGCEIVPRLGRELLGFIWAIGIQVIETPPNRLQRLVPNHRNQGGCGNAPTLICWYRKVQLAMRLRRAYFSIPAANQG